MSQRLISRSDDLRQLRDEGYDVTIQAGYLLLRSVPFVTATREIARGTLISKLTLAGDATTTPDDHVAYFIGEYPCRSNGSPITQIANQSGRVQLTTDLAVDHTFSSKPAGGRYADYHEKMTTYVAILASQAEAIDPHATAQIFPVIKTEEDESVFHYIDTAASRAGIASVTQKLELGRIAIVGLGGTGSYVLDLVAKTPVREIHLYDGDAFLQHNAFRSPGAPAIEELLLRQTKVARFAEMYSHIHKRIVPHAYKIDESRVDELRDAEFVFLCLDSGRARRLIIERLEAFGRAFIDVGMGVDLIDGSLGGILRVTTSTTVKRGHIRERISFTDGDDDDYAANIQIADLNALSAALAVIKWKKLYGFYRDLEHEHNTTYTIDGNIITNDEQA